jgi:hypothetical protein
LCGMFTNGYDKLKPCGFCILGAICTVDSFYDSNSIKQRQLAGNDSVIPSTDIRGAENSTLALLQHYFCFNGTSSVAGLNSFMYGKSVANKRLESW